MTVRGRRAATRGAPVLMVGGEPATTTTAFYHLHVRNAWWCAAPVQGLAWARHNAAKSQKKCRMCNAAWCAATDLLHCLNGGPAKCGIHGRRLTMSRAGYKGVGVMAVGLAFRGGYWLAEICRPPPLALKKGVYVKLMCCERAGCYSYGRRWLHFACKTGLTVALAMRGHSYAAALSHHALSQCAFSLQAVFGRKLTSPQNSNCDCSTGIPRFSLLYTTSETIA